MRIKVILQNYNTIHTKYQELLSAMLKEQRGERMDEEFIRNRITELRLKKGVSEYQMSMELGQNRSYIQAISSGRSMPSMKQFLNICEYFEITPLQFFDAQENNPQLIKKALDGMRKMSDDDLIILAFARERRETEVICQIAVVEVDGENILPDVWYDIDFVKREAVQK